MLDAARNDDHFDRSQLHNPISELDATRTRQTRNISQHRRDGAIATAIRVAVAAGLCSVAGLLGGLFRGRRWLSCDLLLGFFYGMDQQTAQGTVLIMGGAQCRVGIFALSATLRRRSAHGGDHRRVGFGLQPIRRPVWRPASTRMSYGSPSLSFSPRLQRPSPTTRGAAARG